MADKTGIEWTDATWQIVTGCSVVSPGCTNCYAMKLAGTRLQHHPSRAGLTRETKSGPVWTGEVRFNGEWLLQPLRWLRPRRIFVAAHGDLFHENVKDEWLDEIFAVMALAHWHTFQVLTKRPERALAYLTERWQPAPAHSVDLGGDGHFGVPAEKEGDTRWTRINEAIDDLITDDLFNQNRFWTRDGALIGRPDGNPLPNVWIGTSVEDQERANQRIPILLRIPAAIRWLSCEPLLGPVDLGQAAGCGPGCSHEHCLPLEIDWVVVGGESGPGARPMDEAWARSLRDQCAAADVPFFCKQLSIPGSTKVLKDLADFPADLRVRECPNAEGGKPSVVG